MAKAIWNGEVIAESSATQKVDGYTYFPPESVRAELLEPSTTETVCFWKGTASYFSVVVRGKKNNDAAWTYRDPSDAAAHIKGYIGFWKGIEVEK